jgi:glutathione S-transferase
MGIPSDEITTKSSVTKLHAKLDVLEKILATQDYLGGAEFTIVDAFYMPAVHMLHQVGEGPAFQQRQNISSWWNRVSSRGSWKKVNGN